MGLPPLGSAMTYSPSSSASAARRVCRRGSCRSRCGRCGCCRSRRARHRGAARHAPERPERRRRRSRDLRRAACAPRAYRAAFLRFSIFFSFSSMRTVMNLITMSVTRRRRSTSFTSSGVERELNQDVMPFVVFRHAIGQLAHAPLVDLVDGALAGGDHVLDLFDESVDFFFRRIRLHDEQLFVDSHSSSCFKPWARRLKIVMDFSTPSAIMDSTAAAPCADHLLHFLHLCPLERREHKLCSIPDRMPGMDSQPDPRKFAGAQAADHALHPVVPRRRAFRLDPQARSTEDPARRTPQSSGRVLIRTARAAPLPPDRSDS